MASWGVCNTPLRDDLISGEKYFAPTVPLLLVVVSGAINRAPTERNLDACGREVR
jgi:hypothetical protein